MVAVAVGAKLGEWASGRTKQNKTARFAAMILLTLTGLIIFRLK
jgi:hypothetical protein